MVHIEGEFEVSRPLTFALLVSAATLALPIAACQPKPRPTVNISPPANLLTHSDEPATPDAALTSEEAYERSRDAKIEWGRANADAIDRACRWFRDAGVTSLTCRDAPPQPRPQ